MFLCKIAKVFLHAMHFHPEVSIFVFPVKSVKCGDVFVHRFKRMRNLWLGLLTIEKGDNFAHFYTFISLQAYGCKWKNVNIN